MNIETLLSHFDGVKETGDGKYFARCPAHDDKSPSLSIRETDDGRVLLHCFAGCDAESILSALSLEFSDLYPESLGHHFKPIKQRVNAREILCSLDHESLVVAIIGADFVKRKSLDDETWHRLAKAVSRINSGRAQVAPLKSRHFPQTDTPNQSQIKEQA